MIIFEILMVVVIVVCILLILIILSQNPKGGGLSSTFGGSGTQMFGVQKTNDFMENATWTLATFIVILSLMAGVVASSSKTSVYLPNNPVQQENTQNTQ